MREGLLLVVWSSIGLWVGLVCGSKVFTLRWVGLGQSFGGVGGVALKKSDPGQLWQEPFILCSMCRHLNALLASTLA